MEKDEDRLRSLLPLLRAGIDYLEYLRMNHVENRSLNAQDARTEMRAQKDERDHGLQSIRDEMGDCVRCKLCKGRKSIVFGEGNPSASLMFIGEGPGADEDEQGRPFVGRAGQLLTKMIEAMGFRREDVYIANIVKCRPPNNRNPEPDEIESCEPFLKKQIGMIRPKVIVALGKFAAQTLLKTPVPISRLRGRFGDYEGIAVMPTYHPAYLLRSPGEKRVVWDDLKKVMEHLKQKGAMSEGQAVADGK